MEIECIKCKTWDIAAKKNGHSWGMCEECFKKSFVPFQPERIVYCHDCKDEVMEEDFM